MGSARNPHIQAHRFERSRAPSLRNWGGEPPRTADGKKLPDDAVVPCGWGRLIFAHTFRNVERLVEVLAQEAEGQRDIALYLRDPHVVLSLAPQACFLDPSHTYRLWPSAYPPARRDVSRVVVRRLQRRVDVDAMNTIYLARHMVPVDSEFVWQHRRSRSHVYFVAQDPETKDIWGTVTGVDHGQAFDDPERGTSLWALAVHPQTPHPGVGEALTRKLAEHFFGRGAAFMDLSVMHDNQQAIALYEKLGFVRVPVFCLKKKNPINEPLFSGPAADPQLNPYARIIVDEARRRGINVDVLDAAHGHFALSFGGRTVTCRESLSELTSAVAMWRCDDKEVTSGMVARQGIHVPARCVLPQGTHQPTSAALDFLAEHGRIVVKPARGEQGRGVTVDVQAPEELAKALHTAAEGGSTVVLEERVEGHDLRVIVIADEVVAAAVRRPPVIVGTGQHTVRKLVAAQSRRRAAATGGESTIPVDEETERTLQRAGYSWDDVPAPGVEIRVRNTANLHTGGTIHDVTAELHPALAEAARHVARVLEIPVVGIDFIVPAPNQPEYWFIEANERPGLANHEPQPTAERFIDLLFPQTVAERGAGRARSTP